MQPEAASSLSYSSATLLFVTDAERSLTAPVGVLLCRQDSPCLWHRFLSESESTQGVSGAEVGPYLSVVLAQLSHWVQTGELPYQRERLPLFSEAWWQHVRQLLNGAVQITSPHWLDVHDPEAEVEALFKAVVRPRPERRQQEPVDFTAARAPEGLSRV